MDQLIRQRLHDALDVEPTPGYLRSQVMRSLPVARVRSGWRAPRMEWARPWVAALIAAAVVAGLAYVGHTLGPRLVHPGPRSVPPAFLSEPSGLAIGPNGSLYFTDLVSGYVFRLQADGSIVTVAGTRPDVSINEGDAGNNGPATRANLFAPGGLAFDASGNMYIADTGGNRIRKVDRRGIITTLAGSGPAGSAGAFAGDGGRAVAARLNLPYGLAFDAQGNLYVADTANGKIRRIDKTGTITSLDTSTLPTPESQFQPEQVAFDAAGNLFVLSTDNPYVRSVPTCEILRRTPDGVWSRFAGTGFCGFGGDGGTATAAEIEGDAGLALDPAGNLYFADASGRVRRVDRDGIITTVASGLVEPQGLAFAPDGRLYVAEFNLGQFGAPGRPYGRISLLDLSTGTLTTVLDSRTPIHTSS